MQADLPLTAAIRQSQQTLYHSHPQHSADRQGESPCMDQGVRPNPFWGAGFFPPDEKIRANHPKNRSSWRCFRCFAWGQVCWCDVNSPVPPLPSSRQSESLSFPAAVHHLRRLRGRGRPVVHAERHQLAPASNAFALQRKALCGGGGSCFPAAWVLLGRRALGMLRVLPK